jgi:transposase
MTSVLIDREIGDWHRFNNRRQIASYTGLCPGEYSSGNTRLQSCVTKHGNPRLRAALVELAWRLVRFQPNYHPVRKWRQILAKGALTTGAARKKAIVAVARQLAVDLWRIKTGRLPSRKARLIHLTISSRGTERRPRLEETLNHFGTWALPGP